MHSASVQNVNVLIRTVERTHVLCKGMVVVVVVVVMVNGGVSALPTDRRRCHENTR